MATIQVDVRPGPNGPMYVISAPAGNTVIINDYMHPDAVVTGTGGASVPVTDQLGTRGKKQQQTF